MSEDRKTVTVACLVPNGLTLRLQKAREEGGITIMLPAGEGVVIGGPKVAAAGYVPGPVMTEGLDREFVEAWLEQNKDSQIVKADLVRIVEPEPQDEPGAP